MSKDPALPNATPCRASPVARCVARAWYTQKRFLCRLHRPLVARRRRRVAVCARRNARYPPSPHTPTTTKKKLIIHLSSSSSSSWCVVDPSIDSRAVREGVHGVLRASSRAIARRPSSSIHPRPRASFRAHRRRGLAMRHHHHHRVRSRFSARRRSYAQTVSRRRRTPRARADDGKIFRVASRGPGPRDPDPRRVVARPGRDRSIEPVMARGKSLPDVRRKKYKKRRRRSRAWLACVDDDDGRASRAIRRSRARVSRGARVGVFAVEDMGMFWVIVCGSWCQGWVW